MNCSVKLIIRVRDLIVRIITMLLTLFSSLTQVPVEFLKPVGSQRHMTGLTDHCKLQFLLYARLPNKHALR